MADRTDALAARAEAEGRTPLTLFVQNIAVYDWVALGFLALAPIALALTGPLSSERRDAIMSHSILFCFVAVAVVLGRFGTGPRSWFVGIYYRTALASAMSVTYVLLGKSLPLLSSRVLDRELYLLDLQAFGFEPAVLMERWATPATTDWFSFFYLGYFGILALFLMPLVFTTKSDRIGAELAFTVLFVYGVGQTLYVVVPGYGPLRALTDAFHAELPGGPIFRFMHEFVSDAGAKKDIFPSLHTGIPASLTLLGFRHRKEIGRRWIPVAFVTVNTIVATMFLRWHYLIDVIAGLVLAFGTVYLADRVVTWELARRRAAELPSLWPAWPTREA